MLEDAFSIDNNFYSAITAFDRDSGSFGAPGKEAYRGHPSWTYSNNVRTINHSHQIKLHTCFVLLVETGAVMQ